MTDGRIKLIIPLFIFTMVYYMPNCIFEILRKVYVISVSTAHFMISNMQ